MALTEGQGHNELEERPNIGMIVTEGHNNYDCEWMIVTEGHSELTQGCYGIGYDRRS